MSEIGPGRVEWRAGRCRSGAKGGEGASATQVLRPGHHELFIPPSLCHRRRSSTGPLLVQRSDGHVKVAQAVSRVERESWRRKSGATLLVRSEPLAQRERDACACGVASCHPCSRNESAAAVHLQGKKRDVHERVDLRKHVQSPELSSKTTNCNASQGMLATRERDGRWMVLHPARKLSEGDAGEVAGQSLAEQSRTTGRTRQDPRQKSFFYPQLVPTPISNGRLHVRHIAARPEILRGAARCCQIPACADLC